jgi:hypothetical protein
MLHPGVARNFESTLRGLGERGHEVELAFELKTRENLPRASELVTALTAERATTTAAVLPPRAKPDLVGHALRGALDYMHYLGPEFAQSPRLRARARTWAPPGFAALADALPARAIAVLRSAFERAERAAPASRAAARLLRAQRPDALVVTMLAEAWSVQTQYVRAAKRLGIPTCLCVASWDNLTTKGALHEVPDVVAVWNDLQREEAIALHGVPADRIVVTGAAAYDHWFGWKPSRDRAAFCAAAGLDPRRPFILYVGSSPYVAPDEARGVADWIVRLAEQGLDDVQVLVRPHPQNPMTSDAAARAELAGNPDVSLFPPEGANPTDARSRSDYFDSLHYCSAVTGVNTSAFLEAAIIGRPVILMLTDANAGAQSGTLHFRYLQTAGGGLLHTARTWPDHAAQLGAALAAPAGAPADPRGRDFVAAFIRPYGLDEPGTPRTVAAIESLADRTRPSPR